MMESPRRKLPVDPDAPLSTASYDETRTAALDGLRPPEFWTDAFSVGHAELDSQHMRLLALCQAADHACPERNPRGSEMLHLLLNELFLYADHHFGTEEGILARAGYPELAEHRDSHQSWLERLADLLVASLERGPDCEQLRAFLLDWWQHHILEDDMRFKPHLLVQT